MAFRNLVVGHFPTPFDGEVASFELGLHRIATLPSDTWHVDEVQLGTWPTAAQSAFLLERKPQAILLQVYRDKVRDALALVEELSQGAPEIPVIWCGWTAHTPYLTAVTGEWSPIRHPSLLVLGGEIEAALPPLLDAMEETGVTCQRLVQELPAVAWLDQSQGRYEGQNLFQRVADLGTLPRVWSHNRPLPLRHGNAGWVELSRGCKYACAFCIADSMRPGDVRSFPDAVLEEEIPAAWQAGVRMFGLLAAATNYDLATLHCVRRALEKLPGPMKVAGTVHAKYLDDERLEVLGAFQWETMIVGLQTITAEAQRIMGRKEEPDAFAEAVGKLSRFAVPEVELILGLPGDTEEGFRKSVEFVLSLPVSVSVYRLRLDPWSRYLADRERLGIEADFRNLGRVTSLPGFDRQALDRTEAWLMGLGRGNWNHRATRMAYDGKEIFPQRGGRPMAPPGASPRNLPRR